MRALLVGYFSTFGDIEVLWQVERQLIAAEIPYDCWAFDPKVNAHLAGAVDIHRVDPANYTHLCIVCGPFNRHFYNQYEINLDRFSHCTRVGINLTMVEDLNVFNPLDAIVGRDSNRWSRPDLSFLENITRVPVAGLCLARNQGEYGSRQLHDQANDLLKRLADRNGLATLELDTEFPPAHNTSGITSPEQFESVCSRLDVMLTTRLHGMVLSLKNGIPVIALDAISGKAKVSRQATAIGWPEVFSIDSATNEALDEALARCLSPVARQRALDCAANAREAIADFPSEFMEALQAEPQGVAFYTPSRSRRFRTTVKKYMPANALRLRRAVLERVSGLPSLRRRPHA